MRTRRVGAALMAVLVALTGLVSAGSPAAAGESGSPFRLDPTAPLVAPGTVLDIGKGSQVRLLRPTSLAAAEHAKAMQHPKAAAPDASLAAVTCYVGGDGPRRTDRETVYFGVTVNCDGAVKQITMYLYLFRNVSGTGWEPFASRGPDRTAGTLFIVGLSRSDPVCLPANYIGVAHVIVDFLDGYPLHLEGIFQTPSIFVGC